MNGACQYHQCISGLVSGWPRYEKVKQRQSNPRVVNLVRLCSGGTSSSGIGAGPLCHPATNFSGRRYHDESGENGDQQSFHLVQEVARDQVRLSEAVAE